MHHPQCRSTYIPAWLSEESVCFNGTWLCKGRQEGTKKSIQSCVNFRPPAQNTPPPNPPSWPPTLMKRVSICSGLKQLSACTVLCQIMQYLRATGQKLVCACSCTDHLFSAQIQPKPLPRHFFTSIMQLIHNAMRKLQVWNQFLVICLNTLPRPTWGHSMQSYDQAPRPPPLIESPNKGANQLRLSWGFQKYINISWKWPS
jgi:hypothetical protein